MPTVDQLQRGKAVCARLLFSNVHTHTAKLYSVRVPSWRVSYFLLPIPFYPLLPSFCCRLFPIPCDNQVVQVRQVCLLKRGVDVVARVVMTCALIVRASPYRACNTYSALWFFECNINTPFYEVRPQLHRTSFYFSLT